MKSKKTSHLTKMGVVMAGVIILITVMVFAERAYFMSSAEYKWPISKVTTIDNLSMQKLEELRKDCGEPLWIVETNEEKRARCGLLWPDARIFVIRK